MSILEFDKNGELPPGEHFATIEQIDERFGKANPRRIALMAGLKSAIENFISAGVGKIWIEGSFFTCDVLPSIN